MSTEIYRRLRELLPDQPVMIGTVSAVYPNKTALIELLGGGFAVAANPIGAQQSARVFVRDDLIVSEAPNLPIEEGGEI